MRSVYGLAVLVGEVLPTVARRFAPRRKMFPAGSVREGLASDVYVTVGMVENAPDGNSALIPSPLANFPPVAGTVLVLV